MRTMEPAEVRVSNVILQDIVRMDSVRPDSAPTVARDLFGALPKNVVWRSIYLDGDDGLVMCHDPVKHSRRDKACRTGFYFPQLKCGTQSSSRERRAVIEIVRLAGFEVSNNVRICLSYARFVTFHKGWQRPVVKIRLNSR